LPFVSDGAEDVTRIDTRLLNGTFEGKAFGQMIKLGEIVSQTRLVDLKGTIDYTEWDHLRFQYTKGVYWKTFKRNIRWHYFSVDTMAEKLQVHWNHFVRSKTATQRTHFLCQVWLRNVLRVTNAEGTDFLHSSLTRSSIGELLDHEAQKLKGLQNPEIGDIPMWNTSRTDSRGLPVYTSAHGAPPHRWCDSLLLQSTVGHCCSQAR
jgi:hypothetical protein